VLSGVHGAVVREKSALVNAGTEKIVLADLGREKNPEILKFAGYSPGCMKTKEKKIV